MVQKPSQSDGPFLVSPITKAHFAIKAEKFKLCVCLIEMDKSIDFLWFYREGQF